MEPRIAINFIKEYFNTVELTGLKLQDIRNMDMALAVLTGMVIEKENAEKDAAMKSAEAEAAAQENDKPAAAPGAAEETTETA